MKYYTTLIFLMLITYFTSSKAQTGNEIIEITGQIINAEKLKPVSHVNIINTKNGKITVSDSLGFFHCTMLRRDILRISSIGYDLRYVCFMDSVINDSTINIIKIYEKIYALSKVDIFNARWEDFLFEFSHIGIEDNETQEKIYEWFYSIISPEELALITASVSVGFQIPYTSKREKQIEKVKEFLRKDAEIKEINSKFNPQIIEEVTGLKGDEIKDFVKFCNFEQKYLLRANDYDVITEIKNQFKIYKKQKKIK